ncbi:hypothetical protein Phum_PHUM397000 [Pediculus humanus corporis]|uniref:LEM domain-containing protein n=1 Tax=Pediculus humanus subsp. corporis TaxID=121224 RepID=E0VRC8_PEDHC|nr:uncharacterized protein Phum_PHUM397000 [Pediculus humanus corporis]EEB15934.1 hypothetical protein Phum_PHUM397000 [Pediculus humanus corporis]
MLHLTNEEIRDKLLELNCKCGPVTDTTRDVYLKKLNNLIKEKNNVKRDEVLNDSDLYNQLISYGQSVAPINSTNRHIYMKRLQNIKKSLKTDDSSQTNDNSNTDNYYEPMEID